MQLGLKNRLRLISLLPILILFLITSYYTYESFINYKAAQVLQDKLSENKQLNELVGNISRERGMTVMYLGNSSPNTLKSLTQQRKIVDSKFKSYVSNTQNNSSLHDHSNGKNGCKTCLNIESISSSIDKIKSVRLLVDQHKTNFEDIYEDIYGKAQHNAIVQLEKITKNQTDSDIKELSTAYISLVRAKEFTASERDLISYALARSTEIESKELNLWISLIAKSELISYDTLHNKSLIGKLDLLFKDEDNRELIEDINSERTNIISSAASGKYDVSPAIWFTMLSEKVNIISKAEEILLSAMDERAATVEENLLQLLIISLSIWLTSIILAILGFLLSNEIAKNIKNLENVLKRVARDTKDTHGHDIDVNLHSSDGTTEAYKLLETIIEQTREDKISAQEASEAKSMFLANMSHEIRTPLNGIVGFTELLKDTGLGEEQSEFVEIIEKSSENLLEIINNILDLSKIESNKLEIEDIIFNPIEEFESAVEVYSVRASEKHIDLGCFIDPELEQPLKGDPTKIKEVIINLLSNAVKFTSSSGAINVNVRKVKSEQSWVTRIKFEVQDSGIGVTSEQKARIFEAFSQADTSITRKYGGTGLGLTISSRFIELMGGQLDLNSEPGEGTTFFFTIDFEEVETLNDTSKGNYSNINALVLEDTHKFKKQGTYLREYLDFYGVSYTTFKDEEELQLLKSQVDYDLLFIDYDYCAENTLINYSKQPQELVLVTKSTYMKKIDSMDINIFKSLYEPLNNSKLKQLLDNYHSQNFKAKKSKKISRKKFNADKSRFDAKILVAEDNIINQKLIKRTLEDIGLKVTIASNGLEAFQKRKDEQFDLIFMDIQMPFLDGVEATKEILEYEEDYNQPHVPIIALTANALKGDRERFLADGLDEYTTKPLVRSEIISLLNNFLSDHIVENIEGSASTNDTAEIESQEEFADEINIEPELALEVNEDVNINGFNKTSTNDEVENLEELREEELVGDLKIDDAEKLKEPNEQLNDEVDSFVEVSEEDLINEQHGDQTPIEVQKPKYKADILLAKKSPFESKLYIQILESLGYTYDVAHSKAEIDEYISSSTYKVILFDKECEDLDLIDFSKTVKNLNNGTDLDTFLILISDPSVEENPDDALYVHEIIKNVVNKDLLRLVFEKFI